MLTRRLAGKRSARTAFLADQVSGFFAGILFYLRTPKVPTARLPARARHAGGLDHPLVSIVVPAYNAQDTLNATLTSLRNQTFERLEIFVVDDGSRDATAAVASSHAAADPRVRLIQQRNGGVARARNAGLAEAEGSYVAFVDADDLCAPERTSKMLAAMWRMGDDCALAYTWSTHIDGSGRIVAESQRSEHEGWVHDELCKINFVGNGSAALVRTDVARAVGGFDPTLREVGAQGCEDIDFYLRVARRHKFAVVREFLTGYRQSVSNMSSDGMQMYRSFRRVERRHGREVPAARAALKLGRKYVLGWLLSLASLHGRYRTYWKLVPRLALIAPRWAYNIVVTHRVTSPGEELPIVDDALLADSRNPDRGARFPIGGPVVTGASHV